MTREEYATIVQEEIEKLIVLGVPAMRAIADGTLNAIERIVALHIGGVND